MLVPSLYNRGALQNGSCNKSRGVCLEFQIFWREREKKKRRSIAILVQIPLFHDINQNIIKISFSFYKKKRSLIFLFLIMFYVFCMRPYERRRDGRVSHLLLPLLCVVAENCYGYKQYGLIFVFEIYKLISHL